MALHNQNQNNGKDGHAEQAAPRYNTGETYNEAMGQQSYSAPGSSDTPRFTGAFASIFNLVDDTPITQEIKDLILELRSPSTLDALKTVKDFTVSQYSDPKSVYVLRGRSINTNEEVAMLLGFTDLIGSKIPANEVRARVLEIAYSSLRRKERNLRIIGQRLFTKNDVVNRRSNIIKDVVTTFEAMVDNTISKADASVLLAGNPSFRVRSTNLEEIRAYQEKHSPNVVLPPCNAGIMLSIRTSKPNQNGFVDESAAEYKDVGAVTAMVQFIERVGCNVMGDVGPRYSPHIRITSVDPIVPHAGLYLWLLVAFIDKFRRGNRWMDVFYTDGKSAGDPANLFPNPNDTTKMLAWDPAHAREFWAQFYPEFTRPVITLDLEVGRRSTPFQYQFARAASPSDTARYEASEEIIRVCQQFFGADSGIAESIERSNRQISERFSSSHTAYVSVKGHPIDSREITFLTAINQIVGREPDEEIGNILLRPNNYDNPAYVDAAFRNWLGGESYNPMFDTKSVVISEAFIQACIDALHAKGMCVYDADISQQRAFFDVVNNVDSFIYNGGGSMFTTQNGTPGMASDWSAFAG